MKNSFNSFFIVFLILFSITEKTHAEYSTPIISSEAWVLMSYDTGEILAEKGGDEKVEPASLVKLMTSYLIAKSTYLGYIKNDDNVTIDKEAWAFANPVLNGSPLMFLKADEHVSIYQLKKGLIIQSANDAAIALAKYMASNQDSFVDQMNKMATSIGMTNTYFKNVHGLNNNGEQYTTAFDMALLARHLIKETPDDYNLYKEKQFTYNGIKQFNRNKLLYQSKLDIDGLITGTTSENKYHIVTSGVKKGVRYIAVILGADSSISRFNEADKLLSWGFDNYTVYKPDISIDSAIAVRIWYADKSQLLVNYPRETAVDVKKEDIKKIKVNYIFDNPYISAPITKGQVVGYAEFIVDDTVIATRQLIAIEDVDDGNIFENIWDYILQTLDKIIEDIKSLLHT